MEVLFVQKIPYVAHIESAEELRDGSVAYHFLMVEMKRVQKAGVAVFEANGIAAIGT